MRQVPELLDGNVDPLQHYLDDGVDAGIDPHPLFDTAYYVKRNWSVMDGENPLVHYLVEGYVTECDPSPFFDSANYLDVYPDVAVSGTNPLIHYALFGATELRRRPHPQFDPKTYVRRRNLVKGTNPLVDFTLRVKELKARESRVVDGPDVSIVILNLNKSVLTIECVLELMNDGDATPREIIVVDNGSRASDFARLTDWLPSNVHVIRLATNRGFGEGNNIGVDAARGRLLLFLNNDAFVSAGTIATLADVLAYYPDAGAVGPKFLYPDGRIQEAGAFVSSCGTVTQRGKSLDDLPSRFAVTEIVDYVSAACVLIPRILFDAVGGFDLAWDPAYYEDTDLCFKLQLLGKYTYYCADAVVTHIESATSTDMSLGLRLATVVQVNREKFIARWGTYIERRRDPASVRVMLPPPLREPADASVGTAVLYTPYQIIPGGGERYLLSIARWLSRRYRTYVLTPERYSTYRLRGIGLELELDLSEVRLATLADLPKFADCDVFVAMGNEALPAVEPIGRRKLYMCQFPFPMQAEQVANSWGNLEKYDDVIVNSEYTKRHLRERTKRLTAHEPRVTIVPPAVPMYREIAGSVRVPGRIVNVGRFHSSGHCKRQDVLVDAFRRLVERTGRNDLELHLAGTVSSEALSREFYLDVQARATGLPVYFHLNASPEKVRELYATSSYYWHGTGYGQSETLFPERMEHFGITVVEAMSAGAIPFVYAMGGPAEIVADGETGFQWRSIVELVNQQSVALELSKEASDNIRYRGYVASLRYDTAAFEDRLGTIVNRYDVERSAPNEQYIELITH